MKENTLTTRTPTVHRYSPKPIEGYTVQIAGRRIGPESLRMLHEPEVWNLAWLGFDFEASPLHPFHPDPAYAVNCWHSAWFNRYTGEPMNPFAADRGATLCALLRGPAEDFTRFLGEWGHTRQLPLYRHYGVGWLQLVAQRARLARPDNATALIRAMDAMPPSLEAATALLERFRNPR